MDAGRHRLASAILSDVLGNVVCHTFGCQHSLAIRVGAEDEGHRSEVAVDVRTVAGQMKAPEARGRFRKKEKKERKERKKERKKERTKEREGRRHALVE